MTLGERIKVQRQNAGMSQEKLAELVGVSRQAVAKWELGQSAPNTENLFRLAEIFGTTVDLLLNAEKEEKKSPAEEIYYMYKMEQAKKREATRKWFRKNCQMLLLVLSGYALFFLLGKILWVDFSAHTVLGWLFYGEPAGKDGYLYGWLIHHGRMWIPVVLGSIPAILGKYRFSFATLGGFWLGFLAGFIWGPNPDYAANAPDYYAPSHYGAFIWMAVFLVSVIVGIVIEKRSVKKNFTTDKTVV